MEKCFSTLPGYHERPPGIYAQSSGKSLYYVDSQISVSLIRLGGRKVSIGCISHVLCFRHSFLPNLNEVVVSGFEPEVFAYPIKLEPLKVKRLFGIRIRYQSRNRNYDYERFCFADKTEKQVIRYLDQVRNAVETVLGRGRRVSPEQLAEEIRKYEESAWVE